MFRTTHTTRWGSCLFAGLLAASAAISCSAEWTSMQVAARIDSALAGAHREAHNAARDGARHAKETLLFFGLKPDMRVVEILPGRGWYTEVLAPIMAGEGTLVVATFGADNSNDYLANLHNEYIKKLDADPSTYGQVQRALFQRNGQITIGPANSADMVLVFRSTHNWIRFGGIEKYYAAIFAVLKPGGILGVVQHRARKGILAEMSAEQGYVPEDYLVDYLSNVGFKLVGKSEVNANPKDTKNHPKGVWTLPPSYRLGDKNREKYAAIGESDRMTLKFIKPAE